MERWTVDQEYEYYIVLEERSCGWHECLPCINSDDVIKKVNNIIIPYFLKDYFSYQGNSFKKELQKISEILLEKNTWFQDDLSLYLAFPLKDEGDKGNRRFE